MTYNEFLVGDHKRKIYSNYYINNKGEIYSTFHNNKIKVRNGVAFLSVEGRTIGVTVWKEMVKAFPDVVIPRSLLNRNNKVRGAYPFPNCKHKPWRSVIKVESKYTTIGYYKTKDEALDAYYFTYSLVRGHRPW